MSQTLFLEKNLSWSGLLLEPDPRSFRILQERRRNAWTAPLCVKYSAPGQMRYWLRDLEPDLPEHFLQLLMARSKLDEDTLTGDEERGRRIWVTCAPLSSILMAANMTKIDMLTISTGSENDETKIKDVLFSKKFEVKTVLIHYPTGRLFSEPYPHIPGYILDKQRSTIQIKMYVKRSLCKSVRSGQEYCQKPHYYDVEDACMEYLCFGFLTVWT
nr:protein Star-like [Penaeus vannamei]